MATYTISFQDSVGDDGQEVATIILSSNLKEGPMGTIAYQMFHDVLNYMNSRTGNAFKDMESDEDGWEPIQ